MKRLTVMLALLAIFAAGCGTTSEEKSEEKPAADETVKQDQTEKAESAIKAIVKKARYTFEMEPYDLYIYADDEKESVTEEDWACANAGDKVYTGDYNIATVKKGTAKTKPLAIGKQTFQVPNDGVGVVEGSPSLLVVSHCEASDMYSARLFAIDDKGKAVELKDENGEKLVLNISPDRMKSTGKHTYQTAIFSNAGETDWVFYNWKLDPDTWQLKEVEKIVPADPGKIDMTKWAEDPGYVVEQ